MDVEADIDQRLMEAEEMATMGLTCALLVSNPSDLTTVYSYGALMCMHAHVTALARLRSGAAAVAKVVCVRQEEAGTALASCPLSAASGAI
jgi:hypothetical protein